MGVFMLSWRAQASALAFNLTSVRYGRMTVPRRGQFLQTHRPVCTHVKRSRTLRCETKNIHPSSCLYFIQQTPVIWFLQGTVINATFYAIFSNSNQKFLTASGLKHATGLGILLWTTLWWPGYVLCISLLVVGSLLTKVGAKKKEELGIAEARGGARGPENLWGAAGVAAICALLFCLLGFSQYQLHRELLVAYTASIATKLADTSSSEIGKAFGSRTYLVTTFEPVPRGTEGAVSLEGTAAGFVTACGTACLALLIGLIQTQSDITIVVIAAMIATTVESLIGATLQKRMKWSNELVNFINTAIGASSALILRLLLRGL